MLRSDGPFDREGAVTKFFERVPFVGFVVAGIHSIAGNEVCLIVLYTAPLSLMHYSQEHAKRAIALCANSTIVCGGILIGAFIGGPIGAAVGAALTTTIAILAETLIAGTIKDPQLQAQFEEATIGRCFYETLRNMLAAGAAAYLASFLSTQAGNLSARALGEIAKTLSKKATASASDFAAYWMIKKYVITSQR